MPPSRDKIIHSHPLHTWPITDIDISPPKTPPASKPHAISERALVYQRTCTYISAHMHLYTSAPAPNESCIAILKQRTMPSTSKPLKWWRDYQINIWTTVPGVDIRPHSDAWAPHERCHISRDHPHTHVVYVLKCPCPSAQLMPITPSNSGLLHKHRFTSVTFKTQLHINHCINNICFMTGAGHARSLYNAIS